MFLILPLAGDSLSCYSAWLNTAFHLEPKATRHGPRTSGEWEGMVSSQVGSRNGSAGLPLLPNRKGWVYSFVLHAPAATVVFIRLKYRDVDE